MPSPQSRTHEWLKEHGYIYGKTEMTIHIPAKPPRVCGSCGSMKMELFKRDLFTFVDVIAVHPGIRGTTYIQVTAGMGSHRTERMKKIEDASATKTLLLAGNHIEFHTWRKLGPRGKVKRWTLSRWDAELGEGDKIVWKNLDTEEDDGFDHPVQIALGLLPSPGGDRVH